MIWERLAAFFGLDYETEKMYIEGKCPKCGDNVILEFKYMLCCNPKCGFVKPLEGYNYSQRLGELP